MNPRVKKALISPQTTIKDTIGVINSGVVGIALVVTEENVLLGTVTDGDVRRAILRNVDLEEPVSQIMHPNPVAFREGIPQQDLIDFMHKRHIRHIPILDDENHVIDIAVLWELAQEQTPVKSAIILTGGLGTRLRPLTNDTPKPLLKVGEKPIVEVILDRLAISGIQESVLTTGYLAEKIETYFQAGEYKDMSVKCVRESKKLGTAGPVRLARDLVSEPVLVMNGDILTKMNFRSMMNFHNDHEAVMTVAVKQYDFQVPYGVVEVSDNFITGVTEKPTYYFHVNAGIYLMNFSAIDTIPKNTYIDMPDVIERLVQKGQKVCSFPVSEYWLDIGRPSDFERANNDIEHWDEK